MQRSERQPTDEYQQTVEQGGLSKLRVTKMLETHNSHKQFTIMTGSKKDQYK